MNYSELQREIRKRTGLTSAVVKEVMDTMQDVVIETLHEKGKVTFSRLGNFDTRLWGPRRVWSYVDKVSKIHDQVRRPNFKFFKNRFRSLEV